MPVFVAILWGAFLRIIGSMVGRVLVSLGIAVVTYTGVDTALSKLKGDAITALMGLPPDLVALLSFLKVGVAISIVTSAVAVRLALSGMTGAIKRFRKQ